MKFQKAFTLVETVIVLTMFSTVIILILTAVNKYKTYLAQSRLQTIALNLTREGVEEMYQWRDTNWMKNSADKDNKIFCMDPFNCSVNNITTTGFYILKENTNTGGVKYFMLSGMNNTVGSKMYNDISAYMDESSFSLGKIAPAKIVFTGDFTWAIEGNLSGVMAREGDFYRLVKFNGVYRKDVGNSAFANLNNLTVPVEVDFCVKTIFFPVEGAIGESEICSLITNFKK